MSGGLGVYGFGPFGDKPTVEQESLWASKAADKATQDARKRVLKAIAEDGYACCKDLALLRVKGEEYQFGYSRAEGWIKAIDHTRTGKYEVRAKKIDATYFDLGQ